MIQVLLIGSIVTALVWIAYLEGRIKKLERFEDTQRTNNQLFGDRINKLRRDIDEYRANQERDLKELQELQGLLRDISSTK